MQECASPSVEFLEPLNEKQTVFLARDTDTGLILTARQLTAAQTEPYRRLLGERIAHVPAVRGIRQDSEDQYLVFSEYIPGVTLERLLAQYGTLDTLRAVRLAVQLCGALTDLQALGVVHRDIKPANIIVTEQQEAWLIDFDISRLNKQDQSRDTRMMGTMGYAAPEQFGFCQTDSRADLYALGVLLNVMVTGVLPAERMAQGPLRAIVERCTRMDPADRYETPGQLCAALNGLLPRRPAEAPPRPDDGASWIRTVPGFRAGDPRREKRAFWCYLLAAFLFAMTMTAAAESQESTLTMLCLWLFAAGWYGFWYDCRGFRSRFPLLKRLRGGRWYRFAMIAVTAVWLAACMLLLGVLLASVRAA